jgi:ABC-2 type transport system permease protein
MTSKLLAALTSLLITDLVVWVMSLASVAIFHGEYEYDLTMLLLLMVSLLLFQLFFLAVGLIISLLVRRVRNVTPYALGLAFGAYVLSAFSGILGDVKLELITPFKHWDVAYIVQNQAYDLPLVLLNLGVTLLAIVLSYWRYIRRDIPSVS